MSVLTVPVFSAHLLKTVSCTQGLLSLSEYHVCPPEEDPSAQVEYLTEILQMKKAAGNNDTDVAEMVWTAWDSQRHESALLKLTLCLQRYSLLTRLRSFQHWQQSTSSRVSDQSFRQMQARVGQMMRENHALARGVIPSMCQSTAYSFDSAVSAPEAQRAPLAQSQEVSPAISACERLFSAARSKEQAHILRERIRTEQATAGCTFRPDTASSSQSFLSLQSSHVVSRTSTPSKPRQKSSEELAAEECSFSPTIISRPSTSNPGGSPFTRLYSHDKSKRNQQRLKEAEKQAKETQDCTFKPAVLRSVTPEPQRYEQLHEVRLTQNYAHILQRRRLKELNHSEMETRGLTFKPTVNKYTPVAQPVKANVEEVKSAEPVRLKPQKAAVSKHTAKTKSMDLMTRLYDSVGESIHR